MKALNVYLTSRVFALRSFSILFIGQFYAHFHKDSFRFLQDDKRDPSIENSSFVLLIPSVSPVYRNNPSFRVVHVDPDLQALTDYEQYYMNLVMATGKCYNFVHFIFVEPLGSSVNDKYLFNVPFT